MSEINVLFYYASYLGILLIVLIFTLCSPFFLEDILKKRKIKKLVNSILDNKPFFIYDIKLLENLLRANFISEGYIKYFLLQLLIKANKENRFLELIYFHGLYDKYLANENYERLPNDFKNQIYSIKRELTPTKENELAISFLIDSINILLNKDNKFSKQSLRWTIVSTIVTIISVIFTIYPIIKLLNK